MCFHRAVTSSWPEPGTDDGVSLDVGVTLRRGSACLRVVARFGPGFTAVLGPSGAGKSTLVAAIAGIVRPTAGRITLGDTCWFDAAGGIDLPAQERRAGVVFQGLALFPHLRVAANVGYGVSRDLPAVERDRRIRGALALTRATHLADRAPGTLSGGEAQRVALARALAPEPRVLLLDEPLAALDDALRGELLETLRACVTARPLPVLYVTHRADEAEALGARTLRLAG